MILPFCIVISAIIVNEVAYNKLPPSNESISTPAPSNSVPKDVESPEYKNRKEVLGSCLFNIEPGFCISLSRPWFSSSSGLIIWFILPAGTMITFNFIALLIVCVQICRLSKDAHFNASPQNDQEKKRREKSKNLAGICCKLAIILGFSWFMQMFAGMFPNSKYLVHILALVNAAQGGVIAITMLVSVKARRALASMLPESCRGYIAPVSTTQSKDRDTTSSNSRTWTSVLLPRRSRPQNKLNNETSDH